MRGYGAGTTFSGMVGGVLVVGGDELEREDGAGINERRRRE